jgi:hypothetical protein
MSESSGVKTQRLKVTLLLEIGIIWRHLFCTCLWLMLLVAGNPFGTLGWNTCFSLQLVWASSQGTNWIIKAGISKGWEKVDCNFMS